MNITHTIHSTWQTLSKTVLCFCGFYDTGILPLLIIIINHIVIISIILNGGLLTVVDWLINGLIVLCVCVCVCVCVHVHIVCTLDGLGIRLDDTQPSIPPAKPAIDYSHEASEYEQKLIQVSV